MRGSYTRNRIKALRERGKLMAEARWKIDRARRDAEMPDRIRELAEIETQNLPHNQGDSVGCLQWTDFRTGKVRRWIIRLGNRADRVTMESPDGRETSSHGWTWIMDNLRGYLCGRKI